MSDGISDMYRGAQNYKSDCDFVEEIVQYIQNYYTKTEDKREPSDKLMDLVAESTFALDWLNNWVPIYKRNIAVNKKNIEQKAKELIDCNMKPMSDNRNKTAWFTFLYHAFFELDYKKYMRLKEISPFFPIANKTLVFIKYGQVYFDVAEKNKQDLIKYKGEIVDGVFVCEKINFSYCIDNPVEIC